MKSPASGCVVLADKISWHVIEPCIRIDPRTHRKVLRSELQALMSRNLQQGTLTIKSSCRVWDASRSGSVKINPVGGCMDAVARNVLTVFRKRPVRDEAIVALCGGRQKNGQHNRHQPVSHRKNP